MLTEHAVQCGPADASEMRCVKPTPTYKSTPGHGRHRVATPRRQARSEQGLGVRGSAVEAAARSRTEAADPRDQSNLDNRLGAVQLVDPIVPHPPAVLSRSRIGRTRLPTAAHPRSTPSSACAVEAAVGGRRQTQGRQARRSVRARAGAGGCELGSRWAHLPRGRPFLVRTL